MTKKRLPLIDLPEMPKALRGRIMAFADLDAMPAAAKAAYEAAQAARLSPASSRPWGGLAQEAEIRIANLSHGDALPPVHPGEVLAEEFMAPIGLGSTRLARALRVPRTRIERLIAGETAMTEDTALRLERWSGASAEFWLGLQTDYNLRVARAHLNPDINAIEPAVLTR